MTPAARLQASIELLETILGEDRPPVGEGRQNLMNRRDGLEVLK
jgi:hypothetical protein